MRALPVLEGRRGALEKCVFCPKLCRSACPVSNAEPRETVTPWGKMSLAWMAAHGDVPLDASHAAPAWACTGCLGCREACDHRNPVADVLFETRSALVRGDASPPPAAARTLATFARHEARTRDAARRLGGDAPARGTGPVLLVGCGYLRGAPRESRDAIDVARVLDGGPTELVDGCCGLPLLHGGDGARFAAHAQSFAARLRGRPVTVVDPGCGYALRHHYPRAGAAVEAPVELLVERAARELASMTPVEGGPVRWHDPCQLGRGLGVYEAPRAILHRVLGHAPGELDDHRAASVCSGGGGLLPATMPATASAMARGRIDAHERAGGGRVVTACASSLRSLRREGAKRGVQVDDLVTWIARGLLKRPSTRSGSLPRP